MTKELVVCELRDALKPTLSCFRNTFPLSRSIHKCSLTFSHFIAIPSWPIFHHTAFTFS